MRRITLLIIGLIVGSVITGFFFSSVSRSGSQGDVFYSGLKNGDYEKIISLFDSELLNTYSKEYWLNEFNFRNAEKGRIISYKNTGFHTETIDGENITRLDYEVVYENGKLNERLDFIKSGNDFKIVDYTFSDDLNLIVKK